MRSQVAECQNAWVVDVFAGICRLSGADALGVSRIGHSNMNVPIVRRRVSARFRSDSEAIPFSVRYCFRLHGAEGGTRTPTGFPTTPSRWRVCQFHHFGTLAGSRPAFTWQAWGAPPVSNWAAFPELETVPAPPAAFLWRFAVLPPSF